MRAPRTLPALALLATVTTLAMQASFATPALAQGPVAEGAGVMLDFEDADIKDVIRTIAKLTGKNFLYDDRVQGRITVISPTPVSVEEAYRVFESILQVRGFTTVEGPGGMLKIVATRDANKSPIRTLPSNAAVPNRDLFVTRLIPLKFVKADAIQEVVRPLISAEASIVAYEPTNTLILSDSASNIRRVMEIIGYVDVETFKSQIKVIPIQHAEAGTLAGHLNEIFGEQPQRTSPARRAALARQARAVPGVRPTPDTADSLVSGGGAPRFITDDRTNSIIVIATRAQIEEVQNLIVLLDYQREGTGRIRVVRLQNADAEEMSQTLGNLVSGTASSTPAAGGAAGAAAAGAVADLGEGISITADAPTNSLIIQSSADGFAAVREVIDALDIRRPQVLVEALVMEVDVDDQYALGSGVLYQSLLDDDEGTRIATGSNTSGVDDPFGGLANPITDPGNFTTAILGRTITVLDGEGNLIQLPTIQAIMTARGSDQDTNIVSAPLVLTADNEQAEIVVADNIPIPTTQLATPDTTGGFSTSQNIERIDVGITLRVTPQISEGETIRLELYQEVSELTGEGGDLGPTTVRRTVENTVYVADGEAVMIGGIIAERQLATETKVPFLGDIPVIGWAFKSVSDRTQKTNLLVILTPHIVRHPDDLQRLTVEQRERMRQSAGEALEWDEDEVEKRRAARQAGVDLPVDENPVRRLMSEHEEEYPIEELPQLREERDQREQQRLVEMEAATRAAGGSYLVQVSRFREVDPAAALLTELLTQGYDGTLLSRREGDRVVHIVQLGPYATAKEAHHVAREVSVQTGEQPFVIVEP